MQSCLMGAPQLAEWMKPHRPSGWRMALRDWPAEPQGRLRLAAASR